MELWSKKFNGVGWNHKFLNFCLMKRSDFKNKDNVIVFVLSLCFSSLAFGQFDNLGIESQWCAGKIILNDNTELKGLIQNNDKLGLFRYKINESTSDEDIRSFQEKSIIMLEYFEASRNKLRKFYSLNCNSDEAGFQGALLFEVIHEFKNFAILTRKTRVSLTGKSNRGLEGYTSRKGLIFEQREGIFTVGEDGHADLLLLIKSTEIDNVLDDKSKKETKVNREALKKHIELSWEKVEKFVDDNNLKFSKRDDLLSILDFVKTLEDK